MRNLLVSFSGGETSAFMSQWIKRHLEDKYDRVIYVFANTGLENEETLEFTQKCDDYWGLRIHWVEAVVYHGERKGTGYWLTDFDNAKRNGEPFEQVISKYGIPNMKFPHCTRELKLAPIRAFAKDYFEGEDYDTAVGIRVDEIDRINPQHKEIGIIYPLITMLRTTKPMVNFFWKQMDFRLNLKGYQGNCVTCWKKSDNKLYQIYKENPKAFEFMDRMERKYPLDKKGNKTSFFRKNRTATDIMCEAESWTGSIKDDSDYYTYQIDLLGGDGESCEVFSECKGDGE